MEYVISHLSGEQRKPIDQNYASGVGLTDLAKAFNCNNHDHITL